MKIVKIPKVSFKQRVPFSRPDSNIVKIIKTVARQGDTAVRQFTRKYDNISLKRFELTTSEIRKGASRISKEVKSALQKAANRIRRFAQLQLRSLRPFKCYEKGITLEQYLIPIRRIGLYVPGGRYPLASTVLMGAIPARVAGVKEIIMCTPPGRNGIAPEILFAAKMTGVDRVFQIGGPQAIAAMAYGTRTVPAVDMIVGPGNRYVTEAKTLISRDVGIDVLAGPSEIVILADARANPEFIAIDCLAQAEHDPDARVFVVTTSVNMAQRCLKAIGRLAKSNNASQRALRNGKIYVAGSTAEAIRFINQMAPEHLVLQVTKPVTYIKQLYNYGSLFIGPYSAVAFGDYCSGPNHILPTAGAARYQGGLSVLSFLKIVTGQKIDRKGANRLTKLTQVLAEAEGLKAHAESMRMRVK